MIGRDEQAAVPIAGLHRDLVAERADQFVTRRGRQSAEFDSGPVAADRIESRCLLRSQDPGNTVEIRQSLVMVVRVTLAFDRLAGLVADQLERTRAHDVLLVPARVLVEDLLLVDPGERIGERRQERAGREFEPEDDRQRIRRPTKFANRLARRAGYAGRHRA